MHETMSRPGRLIREGQNSLDQFIGKFLLLFKKRKMAGIVKPDEFLMGSLDGLAVLPNQVILVVGSRTYSPVSL